ncbi:hypothetical protein HK104_002521 [Borealophlyctis nickersoniae]|nr:hypothetical protein HK104_002521 [Borealophlyctis nickersoniae]
MATATVQPNIPQSHAEHPTAAAVIDAKQQPPAAAIQPSVPATTAATVGPAPAAPAAEATLGRNQTVTSTLGRNETVMSNSTLGRNQTVMSQGSTSTVLPPDPADILYDRCVGWLSLVKLLTHHFSQISDTEKRMVHNSSKTIKHWLVPNKDLDVAFSPTSTNGATTKTSGIQILLRALHDEAAQSAAEHDAAYKALHSTTLPTLHAMQKDVQKKMDTMHHEQSARRKEKGKEESRLRALQKALKGSLKAARTPGRDVVKAGDPWLKNLEIQYHLTTARHKFGARTQSLHDTETTFNTWEAAQIAHLRTALTAYASTFKPPQNAALTHLHTALQELNPEAEWETYRSTRLASAQSPSAFSAATDYEGATDPLTRIIKSGPIQRKSKVLKKWKDEWLIVTAAGWMHLFTHRPRLPTDDNGNGTAALEHVQIGQEMAYAVKPKLSVWLKECTLSPLCMPDMRGEEFHLMRVDEHGVFTKKKKAYKFATPSLTESQHWHDTLQTYVAGTLALSTSTAGGGATHSDPRRSTSIASTAASVQSDTDEVVRDEKGKGRVVE